MVHSSHHPLIQHKLAKLRDSATKPKQFRELVREMTLLLGYEATADLALETITVSTPMGEAAGARLQNQIVADDVGCRGCWGGAERIGGGDYDCA